MFLVEYDSTQIEATGQRPVKGVYNPLWADRYGTIPSTVIEITSEQYRDYGHKGQRHIIQKQEDGTLAFVYVEPVESLDDAKAAQWATIKAERDRLEMAGVTYLGKVFDSDSLSVQRIGIAVQAAQAAKATGQPFTVDWTTTDNTVIPLTADEIIGLPLALAAFSNNLHIIAREFRDQIEEATTVDEVKAITWPT